MPRALWENPPKQMPCRLLGRDLAGILCLWCPEARELHAVASQGPRRAFGDGVAVELLNVKTALFFLAVLPQFVAPAQPLVPQLVVLGTICGGLNTLVDVVAVFGANRLLRSSTVRASRARIMTRISGITMLSLGAYLSVARRQA